MKEGKCVWVSRSCASLKAIAYKNQQTVKMFNFWSHLLDLGNIVTDINNNYADEARLWLVKACSVLETLDSSYTWSKNELPADVLSNNFVNRPSFKNLHDPYFDQWSIDAKRAVTFEKWPLVVELKLKMWKNTGIQIFHFSSSTTWRF